MKKLILAMTLMMSSGMQLTLGASEAPDAPDIFAALAGKSQNLGALFTKKCTHCVGEDGQAVQHVPSITPENAKDGSIYLLVCCKKAESAIVALSVAQEDTVGFCKSLFPQIFAKSVEGVTELALCDMKDLVLKEGVELFWGRLCLMEKEDNIEFFWVDGDFDYDVYRYPVNYHCEDHAIRLIIVPAGIEEGCTIL